MKHKKILTVTLLTSIILALSLLTSLESQMPTEAQPSQAERAPQLTSGQSLPKTPGVNYPGETILQTLAPIPNGCIIDQNSIEDILTNVNIILNNALNMADVLNQQPLERQAPNDNLKTILANRIMPQDTTMNCKVLQDNIAYIAKLTTILSENIFYAIPSNAATRL